MIDHWGATADGAPVRLATLTCGAPFPVTVSIAELGATVTSIQMPDRDGIRGEITIGCASVDAIEADTMYLGSTIGRYANRIANGRFLLDGQTITLEPNEGDHVLHGGTDGFHGQVWTATEAGENRVRFEIRSPAGAGGFPGDLDAAVTFTLRAENEPEPHATLQLDYDATTTAATPVNLTNHTYFNLSATPTAPLSAPGSPIDDHVLRVWGDDYLPVDTNGIPTTGPTPVDDSTMDLRIHQPVGDREFDHNYFLLPIEDPLSLAAAILEHAGTGRVVAMYTTKPAMQVYTGAHLHAPWAPRSGLALEPQFAPDSPNRPDFESTILRPGERYRHTTVIRLSTTDRR